MPDAPTLTLQMMLPPSLVEAVKLLRFESASDERLARRAIAEPELATRATVAWLAALVARDGAAYDDRNPSHRSGIPHRWPP